MTDQTNYVQEIFDIFISNEGPAMNAINAVKEKGGMHLDLAVSFGGMLLMIMAENRYNNPEQVWEAVAAYEDMRKS